VLVVASHSEPLLRRLCNKAVLLDAGRVAAFGPVAEIFAAYNAAAAE